MWGTASVKLKKILFISKINSSEKSKNKAVPNFWDCKLSEFLVEFDMDKLLKWKLSQNCLFISFYSNQIWFDLFSSFVEFARVKYKKLAIKGLLYIWCTIT